MVYYLEVRNIDYSIRDFNRNHSFRHLLISILRVKNSPCVELRARLIFKQMNL
jgi:hypothetical protein